MKFKGTKSDKNSWEITEKFSTKLETTVECGKIRIAEVKHYNDGKNDWAINDPTFEEGKANATLIAAAPDLLEALVKLTKTCEKHFPNDLQI
jgi:hypothetical protein